MKLKPGMRLRSTVCDTRFVVLRAPATDVELTCGGAPVAPDEAETEFAAPGATSDDAGPGPEGTQLGKRYEDPAAGLEVLATRGGTGTLAIEGRALQVKAPAKLPSSD
jgi:hypothetical protein